jgi:hypothetical protein
MAEWNRAEMIRAFVFNQPVMIDPDALGISPIGVHWIQRNGVWHLIDWIGEEHYPTAEEFLMEAERLGISRRLPRTLDWSRLCEESRLLVVHRRHWGLRQGPAIFASFPLTDIAVIRDSVSGTEVETVIRIADRMGDGMRVIVRED